MDARFDAVIIGGGPAGAIAALALAHAGWSAALVERGPRWRDKACGHCLSPRACALLEQFGLLSEVREIAVGATRLFRARGGGDPGSSPLESTIIDPLHPIPGLLVERHRFDQWLIDRAAAAGVEVLQPAAARIERLDRAGARIEIASNARRFDVAAGLVIGADGVGSALARAAGLADARAAGRKYAFSFDIRVPHANAIEPGAIEMFLARAGYLGVVRQGDDRLHVAAMVQPPIRSHAAVKRDPLSFVRDVGSHHHALRPIGLDQVHRDQVERFIACGPMPWRPRRIANAHVALIGDAAGYIEPFTGEGIAWALHSAAVLSNVLMNAKPGQWTESLANEYQRRWRREIARRQLLCRAIAAGMQRPRLTEWMFGMGAKCPALTRRIVRQVVAA